MSKPTGARRVIPTTGLIDKASPIVSGFYGYSLMQPKQMRIPEINALSKEDITNEMARAKVSQKAVR